MNTPEMTTAPVNLDVRASSGSRCNPTHQMNDEKGITIMTDTEDTGQKEWPEYLPDRYDRLKGCAEEFASGADFSDDAIITADIVRAFAVNLTTARVLDGLTDHDANTVILLSVLDFSQGIARMAWRLTDWLSDNRTVHDREDDDQFAVVSVLARVLALTTAAFVGDEFEVVQQHYPAEEDR